VQQVERGIRPDAFTTEKPFRAPTFAGGVMKLVACSNCDSTGWMCERHRDRPAAENSQCFDARGCGEATPCRICNTGVPPRMLPGFEADFEVDPDERPFTPDRNDYKAH
jgi:hypothetical protein